jgi:hypothetical protein
MVTSTTTILSSAFVETYEIFIHGPPVGYLIILLDFEQLDQYLAISIMALIKIIYCCSLCCYLSAALAALSGKPPQLAPW